MIKRRLPERWGDPLSLGGDCLVPPGRLALASNKGPNGTTRASMTAWTNIKTTWQWSGEMNRDTKNVETWRGLGKWRNEGMKFGVRNPLVLQGLTAFWFGFLPVELYQVYFTDGSDGVVRVHRVNSIHIIHGFISLVPGRSGCNPSHFPNAADSRIPRRLMAGTSDGYFSLGGSVQETSRWSLWLWEID